MNKMEKKHTAQRPKIPKRAVETRKEILQGEPAKKGRPRPATVAPKKEESKKDEQPDVKPRLRIRVRAYDHKLVDASARQIVEAAERQGISVVGPIPLPTEFKRYTVNRSTFKHKDSREQFEVRVHKRLIDIDAPTAKTIDALTNLNLPAGVDVDIKMTS